MILNLPIITLLCCSVMMCAGTAAAAAIGTTVAVGWDPRDPGARQLRREHRRLLVESFVQAVVAWELLSLFLFVAAADRLHPLFTGAMCAAGTLNASPLGWPTLGTKLAAFLLAGVWLVVDRATRDAVAPAVVCGKQLSLVVLLGVVVAENVLQARYFTGLDPSLLTSCCGTIFSETAGGLGGELASLAPAPTAGAFTVLLLLTLGAAPASLRVPVVTPAFALLSGLLGVAGLASVIAWLGPAIYRLPTHHCPFCVLGREHGYVGYPLYAALFAGTVLGAAAGVVHVARRWGDSGSIPEGYERTLVLAAASAFGVVGVLALGAVLGAGLDPLQLRF